ncbi:hypothetical protein [Streptomyces collinus]|uniref:hypothetical protein n=1 Tax=Streptomyces collinus TaxID=42684 RepID=UPI003F53F92B
MTSRAASLPGVRVQLRGDAVGECCEAYPSRRVVQAARDALRAALTDAVTEEEITKNVASLFKVPKPRRRRIKPWSVVEAGRFLADSVAREDPLFAAWGPCPLTRPAAW